MNMIKQSAVCKLQSVLFLVAHHFVSRGLTIAQIAQVIRDFADKIED